MVRLPQVRIGLMARGATLICSVGEAGGADGVGTTTIEAQDDTVDRLEQTCGSTREPSPLPHPRPSILARNVTPFMDRVLLRPRIPHMHPPTRSPTMRLLRRGTTQVGNHGHSMVGPI